MLISRKSSLSGKVTEMEIPVTETQIQEWEKGELIQNVMPNLTSNQREFLISGITAEEWDSFFPADEE